MAFGAVTWIWTTVFDDHATRDMATGVWVLGIVVACVSCLARLRHLRPDPMRSWRVWFWLIEVSLLTAFVLFDFPVEWWRHGERFSGVVVEATVDGDPKPECDTPVDSWAIRDPATEREVRVEQSGLSVTPTLSVGDRATAVIMQGDPTMVASPEQLRFYLMCWAAFPVLAVLWPLGFWVRYRSRARWVKSQHVAPKAGLPPPVRT